MTNTRKQGKGSSVNDRVEWSGYANINLSAEDKEAVRGGVMDGDTVLDVLANMLGEGHKLSITHDREKDTVSISATGVYKNCKNAGLTLTCFARDLTDALTVLAYKHEVIAKGDWSKYVSKAKTTDDMG